MTIYIASNSYTRSSNSVRRAGSVLLILIGLFASFSASALTNYSVAWESNFHLPPQDSNGWSTLTPSSDSRIMYVSSSGGNDSTGVVYSASNSLIGSNAYNPTGAIKPYATISAAMAQTRTGYPDYVLLKRGDTWTITSGISPKTGRSYSERSVIAYYGSATARPLVNVAESVGATLRYYNGSGSYSAVMGIEFYGYQHDPKNAAFVGYANTNESLNGFSITEYNTTTTVNHFGVLIEDCKFSYFVANVVAQSFAAQFDPTANVVLRRNIMDWHYSGIGGKGYAIYNEEIPLLLEENVFDHDGWYQQQPTSGGSAVSNGYANILSQGLYMDRSSNSIVRRNIYLRTGSLSMKFRADGGFTTANVNSVAFKNLLVDNNLVLQGEVAISLGGNTTYSNGPRFGNIYVVNNVAMDVGTTMPTNRGLGWGMDIQDWQTGVINNNIMAHWGNGTVTSVYGLSVLGTTTNVSITNNIFYDITSAGTYASSNYSNVIKDTSKEQSVSFQSNVFAFPRGGNLLTIDGSGPAFSGNSYYTTSTGNVMRSGGSSMSLSGWLAMTGEGSSANKMPSFVDPNRTVTTYLATRGVSGNTDTLAGILSAQSKFNWNTAYTADAINSYVRAGFCVSGQSCSSTSLSPPSAPVLLPITVGPAN